MNKDNPYMKKKRESKAPLILRVPMHDFESGEQMESELEYEELTIARMPNTVQEIGYTHHVALVYKSLEGEVFSLTLAQHHGEYKPGTIEHFKKLAAEEDTKEPMPDLGNMNGSKHTS